MVVSGCFCQFNCQLAELDSVDLEPLCCFAQAGCCTIQLHLHLPSGLFHPVPCLLHCDLCLGCCHVYHHFHDGRGLLCHTFHQHIHLTFYQASDGLPGPCHLHLIED